MSVWGVGVGVGAQARACACARLRMRLTQAPYDLRPRWLHHVFRHYLFIVINVKSTKVPLIFVGF
jgi:hypothetical protein